MNLFDVIDEAEAREKPECPHPRWKGTETVWPGEAVVRLTSTCTVCGKIRGRYPGEFTKHKLRL